MMQYLTEAGVVGICCILILREVFSFIQRRNGRNCDMVKMARQVDMLYRWHDHEDAEGVKVWYVRRSLEDAIKELATNIKQQTEILREIVAEQHGIRQMLQTQETEAP